MPRNRNDPDPLEPMRRKLEEQQRLLEEQMQKINQELNPDAYPPKPSEPPVWRLEEDASHYTSTKVSSVRRRQLAKESQRDMILFFVAVAVLLFILALFIWVAYVKGSASAS